MHRAIIMSCLGALATNAVAGTDPWADSVVAYNPGADPDPGFTDPATALGQPARYTGKIGGFPGAVTPFNAAFDPDELVSIGFGGSLTLAFDEPVTNDPLNPFGIDLLVFGNTGFLDLDYPNGLVGGLFGSEGGTIDLSADGDTWITISELADAPMPTLGYLDLDGPYDTDAGSLESDFTKPVDPSFDYAGATWDEILAAYDGSGGGVGIDIGAYALDQIAFIRFTNMADDGLAPDIDAVADVAPIPAPATFAILSLAPTIRRRRARA